MPANDAYTTLADDADTRAEGPAIESDKRAPSKASEARLARRPVRLLTGQAGGVEWPDSRSKGDSVMTRQHTKYLEIVGREAE